MLGHVDDAGHELEFYGIVECVDYLEKVEQDLAYDSQNLRRGAAFEVPAADDVWWVPAVSLGDTRYTNAEIAANHFFSVATVKAHVTRILDKLGATNRVQVAIVVHDANLD